MKMLGIILMLTFIAAISCIDKDVLFETPCSEDEKKAMKDMSIPNLAKKLSDQAYTTLGMMEQFKDEYVRVYLGHVKRIILIQKRIGAPCLHEYKKEHLQALDLQNQGNFDDLIHSLKGKEWLRSFEWYQDEVLPKVKEIDALMPSSYLEIFHNQSEILLPKMHKAMQMILGSFMEMRDHGFDTYPGESVQFMKKYIGDSIDSLKSVLCTFTTFMLANDVGTIIPLTQSEVPKITEQINGLLYRDTLNFLDYLSQVFKFVEVDIKKILCEVKTSLGIPCTFD